MPFLFIYPTKAFSAWNQNNIMKTKIVYVLVSQETDYYYEMLLLSLYSLRLYHPKKDAEVEVVMDEDTYQRLVDKKAEMLNDVTPIVVPIPPEYTVMQRSRYLKTQLRKFVKGDFLYIDCDTLICESLADIDKMETNIAMVADADGEVKKQTPYAIELCKRAGFQNVNNQPYFNGGVIFAKDNTCVHLFFEKWYHLWRKSLSNGVPQDQPALCQANIDLNYSISELSEIWNSQMGYVSEVGLNKSKILHYFSHQKTIMRLMVFESVRKGFQTNALGELINNPRTIGVSAFSISDSRLMPFLLSNSFYIYDNIPSLHRITIYYNRFLTYVYVGCHKIKLFLKSL